MNCFIEGFIRGLGEGFGLLFVISIGMVIACYLDSKRELARLKKEKELREELRRDMQSIK